MGADFGASALAPAVPEGSLFWDLRQCIVLSPTEAGSVLEVGLDPRVLEVLEVLDYSRFFILENLAIQLRQAMAGSHSALCSLPCGSV